MPIYKKVNQDFFRGWSPTMAYVLGFFAADGYITVNKRGGQFWCIQITDKKLLEQIRSAVGSNHKISTRQGGKNGKTVYRLQIGSISMCNSLRELGVSERKTKNLSVPHIPQKYLPDFVRGYFDGDGNVWSGYVHKERDRPLLVVRAVFTSCSGGFLESLKTKLEQSGVSSGVLRKEKGDYYRLTYSIHGSLKLYDFMYNKGLKLSGKLFLPRKKGVFVEFIKMQL